MDWIISGSFTALGFATLENVLYFSRSGLAIMPSRFLFTTLLHLAGTGIITAVLAWAPKNGKAAKATKYGTIGAVVTAHAAFDFFILGPFEAMAPLSIFILLALAWRFTRAVLSATSAIHTHNHRWLDYPAGNTFRLLFNSTLALLILSSIYTLQQMPTSLAAREIITAVVITVPVGIVIFRWLGRLTQKENHLPL